MDNPILLLTYEDRDAKIQEVQQKLQVAEEQRDCYRNMVDEARQECADMLVQIEQLKQQTCRLQESYDRQTRTTKEAQEIAQARFKLMMRAARQFKHAIEAVTVREITVPMPIHEARERLEQWLGDDADRFCRVMSVPQPLDRVPAWLRGLLRSLENRARAPTAKSDLDRITWQAQVKTQRQPKRAYLCDQAGEVTAELEGPSVMERAQDVADKIGKWLYLVLPVSPRPRSKASRKTHA